MSKEGKEDAPIEKPRTAVILATKGGGIKCCVKIPLYRKAKVWYLDLSSLAKECGNQPLSTLSVTQKFKSYMGIIERAGGEPMLKIKKGCHVYHQNLVAVYLRIIDSLELGPAIAKSMGLDQLPMPEGHQFTWMRVPHYSYDNNDNRVDKMLTLVRRQDGRMLLNKIFAKGCLDGRHVRPAEIVRNLARQVWPSMLEKGGGEHLVRQAKAIKANRREMTEARANMSKVCYDRVGDEYWIDEGIFWQIFTDRSHSGRAMVAATMAEKMGAPNGGPSAGGYVVSQMNCIVGHVSTRILGLARRLKMMEPLQSQEELVVLEEFSI